MKQDINIPEKTQLTDFDNKIDKTLLYESKEVEKQKNEVNYTCPKCNERMTKKERQKDKKFYYVCSRHWGYPDMIKKGIVKDKD